MNRNVKDYKGIWSDDTNAKDFEFVTNEVRSGLVNLSTVVICLTNQLTADPSYRGHAVVKGDKIVKKSWYNSYTLGTQTLNGKRNKTVFKPNANCSQFTSNQYHCLSLSITWCEPSWIASSMLCHLIFIWLRKVQMGVVISSEIKVPWNP